MRSNLGLETLTVGNSNKDDWIYGAVLDGEMSRLVRSYDWSKTELGALSNWPMCLKSAISMCLTSHFVICLYLGTTEKRMVYNDAFRHYCGNKHPDRFAEPGRIYWHEMWDVIGPMIDSVMTTKVATWMSDHLLKSTRWNYTEEAYWTYSYSPILSEDGKLPPHVFFLSIC